MGIIKSAVQLVQTTNCALSSHLQRNNTKSECQDSTMFRPIWQKNAIYVELNIKETLTWFKWFLNFIL